MDIEERELNERIKKTLAGYEEDYIPGAWENFVLKHKRRKRAIFIRYAGGVAAGLILGIIGLNFYHSFFTESSVTGKEQVISITNNSTSTQGKSIEEIKPSDKKITVVKKSFTYSSEMGKETPAEAKQPANASAASGNIAVSSENSKSSDLVAKDIPVTGIKPSTPGSGQVIPDNKLSDSAKTTLVAESLPRKSMDDNKGAVGIHRQKVKFGVNIAPGINATSSGSSFNYSGGVNIDISLSQKVMISTGLQVEHQSVINKNSAYNSAIPSDRTKAELVNLDIPLNITVKLISTKSHSYYISGGVSSLAYLSEKYTTTSYRQELRQVTASPATEDSKTYKLQNIETTTEHPATNSGTFDLAGRLNLIIGFQRQISPGLSLHIEPYIKIPLSGLATENLKFTTSGVTCKISF